MINKKRIEAALYWNKVTLLGIILTLLGIILTAFEFIQPEDINLDNKVKNLIIIIEILGVFLLSITHCGQSTYSKYLDFKKRFKKEGVAPKKASYKTYAMYCDRAGYRMAVYEYLEQQKIKNKK